MRKHRLIVFILLLVLSGYFAKNRLDEHLKKRADTDIRYLPTPLIASFLSFGFKPALADIYWIEAVNYVGGQLNEKNRNYKYLKAYSDIIFNLDPIFDIFYDWAGTIFIYNGLPISRENVITSTRYINQGIEKFNEVYRYDRNTIVKGAFNYAIETEVRKPSIAYFQLAARTFPKERNMLLVASSYAYFENDPLLSAALKLEFLGQVAFEAQTKDELNYALQVVSSSKMNVAAGDFIKALRIKMESEEDVRKLVEIRLKESDMKSPTPLAENPLPSDPRIENILNIELSRTWMPADLLVLFSL